MRKGDTPMQMILVAVLLGMVLLIISLVYIQYKEELQEDTENDCAEQIRIHSSLQRFTAEELSTKIDCPTKRIETKYPSEEELRELVADEMVECWQTWGEGELRLFKDDVGVYCHVCAVIYPEGTNLVGMDNYLIEGMYNKTHTYAEYFTKTHGLLYENRQIEGNPGWQGTGEYPIGIIFRHEKGWTTGEQIQNFLIGNPWAGAVGGAVLGVVIVKTLPISGALVITTGAVVVPSTTLGGAVVATYLLKVRAHTITTIHAIVLNQDRVFALGCTDAPVGEGNDDK